MFQNNTSKKLTHLFCKSEFVFPLFFGREHNVMCCQCERFTTIIHCAISSTVLSHLLSFTLKCTASTPFEEGKQPLCKHWTRNLSSKLKLPVPLMCQMQWQTMCPNPFLSEQFFPSEGVKNSPQWVISDYVLPAEVIRLWMLKNFQSPLHNHTICFVACLLMVSDIQTLCRLYSSCYPPKQLYQCLCLYCTHSHITILWLRSPRHLIIWLNLCRRLFFT